MRLAASTLIAFVLTSFHHVAYAAVQIAGGSSILTDAHANQIETWIKQGTSIKHRGFLLTNIFDKVAGDGKTSWDFHAAADGKGATISVIRVSEGAASGGVTIGEQIIGGYNPTLWRPVGDYNITPTNVGRRAFLFNLTEMVKQDQKTTVDPVYGNTGQFQTWNSMDKGPTFGAGHDLRVDESLESGYVLNYSYGPSHLIDPIVSEAVPFAEAAYLTYAEIEVFLVSAVGAEDGGFDTPEPDSIAILALGGVGGCAYTRARKRL